MTTSNQVQALVARGVVCPDVAQVFVAPEVDPFRIAPGVVLHPGCRLQGSKTAVGPDCELGTEGPLVLRDTILERGVKLASGYVSGAVFLAGVGMGSGAHVRPGCLLEEGAEGAHCVGLKQTLLMPFTVLGSLINFCDVLMSGGTSRKDHGEVGSSFIHFNYTPHGDKATASLFGDVPRGVMLRSRPVFLGGQGGVVGPARVDFGVVLAAGSVLRGDVLEANRLVIPQSPAPGIRPYAATAYRNIDRVVRNCVHYVAQVSALKAWYLAVRKPIMAENPWSQQAWAGAVAQLDAVLNERMKRLDQLCSKVAEGLEHGQVDTKYCARQRIFVDHWPQCAEQLKALDLNPNGLEQLRAALNSDTSYIEQVKQWPEELCVEGTRWLQSIVDAGVQAGRVLEPGD